MREKEMDSFTQTSFPCGKTNIIAKKWEQCASDLMFDTVLVWKRTNLNKMHIVVGEWLFYNARELQCRMSVCINV